MIILQSFLILILFTPFGLILSNENKKNLDYFSSQLLYGLIIISFIALFLNFFFPLNKLLNTLILILPIFFLIKKKHIYFTKQFFLFLIISTIIITLLIYESHVYRPDAGLYHLPYINIINEEKINRPANFILDLVIPQLFSIWHIQQYYIWRKWDCFAQV